MIILFTQEAIPHYRIALFSRLSEILAQRGDQLEVTYIPDASLNASDLHRYDWATPVSGRRISFLGKKLTVRTISRRRSADTLFITELAAGNLDAWMLLIARRSYILFGHGKNYVNRDGFIARQLERILIRSANHTITYMPSGKTHVIEVAGVPSDRVTVMHNSTDTAKVLQLSAELTQSYLDDFRRSTTIRPNARIAAYVGVLEPFKNIEMLLSAASIAMASEPRIHLIFGGSGSLQPLVEQFQRQNPGRCTYLSHIGPEEWALLGKLAEVLIVPGRVGLVAVDAIAIRTPILTTRHEQHAPEIEYLRGTSYLTECEPVAAELAHTWITTSWRKISTEIETPTVEKAADNIVTAIDVSLTK